MADEFPRPSLPQPPERRGRLTPEQVEALIDAAINLGLHERRAALLLSIPPQFTSTRMPLVPGGSLRDQLASDLDRVNDARVLGDDSDPLRTWLKNALAASGGDVAAEIFREALDELDRLPDNRPLPGRLPRSHGGSWIPAVSAPEYPLPHPARGVWNWPALPTRHAADAPIPCNLATRWGLDRGGFSGVTGGIPGLRLIDALMTTELELHAVLAQAGSPLAFPGRVWLSLPEGSTPAVTWQELARQALSKDGERASPLMAAPGEHTAIAGFVLTRQAERVTADEVINLLEGSCQMHQSGAGAPVAFCLELTGAPREVTTLIGQATTRLLSRGVAIDSFSRTWGPATPTTPVSLDDLRADLARRQLPEAPGLLQRLTTRTTDEEIEQASPDEIALAVSYLRDQHPDLALSLVRVLASSPAEGTRLAALFAAADSDWLLDAWLAGIGQDFGKIPGPARLIPAAAPVSPRTSLVCAVMRCRRYLAAPEALDEAIDRLLSSADQELADVVQASRSGAVRRPAFFDADRGPGRLHLVRRCIPDLVLPVDEVTPVTRRRPAFWRLAQSLDLRQQFLARVLQLPPSTRAVLGLCTADENRDLRDAGRWDEIQDLRRI